MFMLAAQGLRLPVAGVIVALARSVNLMTKTTPLPWHRQYMGCSTPHLMSFFLYDGMVFKMVTLQSKELFRMHFIQNMLYIFIYTFDDHKHVLYLPLE